MNRALLAASCSSEVPSLHFGGKMIGRR